MRIAVAQIPGAPLQQWRETRTLIEAQIAEAAKQHASLVVLPECAWPTYCLESVGAYFASREGGMPEPASFVAAMRESARSHQIGICVGYIEEIQGNLRNAACLIGPDGTLHGIRHKTFLWAFDRDLFEPNSRLEPVRADFGTAGLLICADLRLPEIAATLVTEGARCLLQPTAWVTVGAPEDRWNPQPDFMAAARAMESGIPIASASKWGSERDTMFVGQSLICDGDGNVLAQCGADETRVISAEVELGPSRPKRMSDAERGALLSDRGGIKPAMDVPPLELMLVSGDISPKQLQAQMREAHAAPPRRSGRLYVRAPDQDPTAHETPGRILNNVAMLRPSEDIVELGTLRVAAMLAADLQRFAAIRVSALRGAHLVIAFGDAVDVRTVQTRACENRVVIVWCRSDLAIVIDETGRMIHRDPWPSGTEWPTTPTHVLNVAAAAEKEVAPGTDVITGRRPEQYNF